MTTTTDFSLSPTQQRGLLRLGDILIPGDDVLPSFSQAGVAGEIGRMLPYMNDDDRSALLALLTACGSLPRAGIRGIVAAAAAWRRAPEPAAGLLRMANIGIKGVVHSLYWSDIHDRGIHQTIGYDARVDEAAYEAALSQLEDM